MKQGLLALVLVSLAWSGRAQDPPLTRFILFRDGSILRLPVLDEKWKIALLRPEGGLAQSVVSLSSFQSLTLTRDQVFARKTNFLAAVRQLESENFEEREQAFAELLKLGPEIRPDLEMCLKLTSDFEAQTRIKAILAKLPNRAPLTGGSIIFDLFVLKESHWGYLGDGGIPVQVKGKTYRLGRQDVLGLSAAAPANLASSHQRFQASSGLRRLSREDFPPGCLEEPFETTPDGRLLRIGENIEKFFLSKGFVLSTSVPGSFVSVNSFMVQGKSRGLSAANHQPLWEGEITVRFVQPGREEMPAGVTHFGCHLASVVPLGTAMIAYDSQGRQLGRIDTRTHGHEFFGVSSAVPIHRIRFLPNPQIDRDYSLDDFLFSPPQTPEPRHGGKCAVSLPSGDRIFCRDVTFQRGLVHLHGLPAGLPDWTLPLTQVQGINPPDQDRPLPLPAGVFAQLGDGSVLFGTLPQDKQKAPRFSLRPDLLKDRQDLAGLWSSAYPRLTQEPKPGRAVLWDAWEKKWFDVDQVRFQNEVLLRKNLTEVQSVPFPRLGPLWLTNPVAGPAAGWHLWTRKGDDLVLVQPEEFSGKLSRGIQVRWQGRVLNVSPAELHSLYRVSRNPAQNK